MPTKSDTYVDSSEFQDPSLVSKLLKLQSYCEANRKVSWMTRELICLRISRHEQSLRLHKVPIDIDKCKNYIAVSYTWRHTPTLESGAFGSYTIIDSRFGRSKPSKVRDVVLDRVFRYAEAMGLQLFWIDRECIGQKDSKEKQQALNSMDLVYKNSAHPLGLLAVKLETQEQIDTLQSLIAGDLLTRDGKLYPRPRGRLCEACIDHILRFLDFLLRDLWWSRAWIFQEEYLSSTRMHLLIRCRLQLSISNELGRIPGEICLNASKFREGVTRFLLAVKRHSAKARQRRCTRLLKAFGKYNVQYLFQMDFQHRAMSSRILADIARRDIKEPYDLLPIAANSCNYANRLNTTEIRKLGYSVELCALAMCLLNGELIRNRDLIQKKPDEISSGQYLHYSLFNRFDPPVLSKGLSYLKSCRLRNVFLSRKGIHAQGHLWTVVSKVDTKSWPEPVPRSGKRNAAGLSRHQRDYLLCLLSYLRRAPQYCVLSRCLQTYLDEDLETGSISSPMKEHRDTTAGAIVRAIERKEPLFLVQNSKSGGISGILAGLRGTHSQAFTSLYDGKDADGRVRHSHISIEVETTQANLPLLKALQWVNGLIFVKSEDSSQVVFRWPRVWI